MPDNSKKIEELINELEYHSSRNMGQVALFINKVPVKIQRRGVENYVMYFFENNKELLNLDIKLATKFKKVNKEELVSYLSGNN
ncbi:MAG: hypothetical protein U0457_21575 [Candidatus Sericytochromatia bacterium]